MQKNLIGPIHNFIPVFYYSIEKGALSLGRNGIFSITVDTGFTDYIALPKEVLKKLNMKYRAYETFILADGKAVIIKTYKGKVKVKNKTFKTLFIEGDHLIGMRFLSQIGNKLIVDFNNNSVELSLIQE